MVAFPEGLGSPLPKQAFFSSAAVRNVVFCLSIRELEISAFHTAVVSGLQVWVGGVGNSRWCPTRSGLAVGRYWYGHRSAAGAQILLLGNSQSCCGGYRGLRDWCSEGRGCGAYIKGLLLLCHMFQPMHLAPLGPAVTMEPASSLEVGGKGSGDCLCMGWRGGCGVGWAW